MEMHGESGTRLHNIWIGMRQRCTNPKATGYSDYGGRGITCCHLWQRYTKFRDWALSNGYANNLTLERDNVNGNYEPSNCSWQNQNVQSANIRKRKNTKYTFIGIEQLPAGNWRGYIHVNKIRINLGSYETEDDARIARNNYIISNNLPHTIQ